MAWMIEVLEWNSTSVTDKCTQCEPRTYRPSLIFFRAKLVHLRLIFWVKNGGPYSYQSIALHAIRHRIYMDLEGPAMSIWLEKMEKREKEKTARSSTYMQS